MKRALQLWLLDTYILMAELYMFNTFSSQNYRTCIIIYATLAILPILTTYHCDFLANVQTPPSQRLAITGVNLNI